VTRSGRSRILVLLAARNGTRWLAEQLESILNQSSVDVHIVVSDDCSTDGTPSLIERFFATGRVNLLSASAPSGSAAQNFFQLIIQCDAPDYDYVAFSDQDDIWYAHKLERACAALGEGGSVGYSSAVEAVWDDGRTRILSQKATPTASDFLFEGAGQGCTFVLTAKFYARVREFLIRHRELTRALHYHDWTTYALARSWELGWIFDPEPSMQYRQHSGNDTGARFSFGGVGKRLSLIASGWYGRHVCAIARICMEASPTMPVVNAWCAIARAPTSVIRSCRMAWFCVRGGRRRVLDRAIVVAAALAGKI
jgi:rhamnosyltransferase